MKRSGKEKLPFMMTLGEHYYTTTNTTAEFFFKS